MAENLGDLNSAFIIQEFILGFQVSAEIPFFEWQKA